MKKPVNQDKYLLSLNRRIINSIEKKILRLKRARKNEKSGTKMYAYFTNCINREKRELERAKKFSKSYFVLNVKRKTIKTQKQARKK